jgi:serine/threonine protein kinase
MTLRGSGGETVTGMQLMTPEYASPEQARGESSITTASDIYSLGVIAYQMLSGRTPFEGDFKAVMEAHKTLEPPPQMLPRVAEPLTAIAALSAKAYSHNCARVHRHLCSARKALADTPQATGMDTGIYGGARGDGSEFYLGLGKRKKRNLHTQS